MPGWAWSSAETRRNRMVAAVAKFHRAHGPVAMPEGYTTDAGPDFGAWMARQR